MSPVAAGGPPHTRSTLGNGGGLVSTMNALNAVGDGSNGARRHYPHLEDLTSVKPNVDINLSIRKILQEAELLAKQADTHFDFRRPDIALQEYLRAYILATDFIPRHKDYPSLATSQAELNRSYMGLLKRLKAQQPRFDEAKAIVKEDNERSGVRPLSSGKENNLSRSMNGVATAAHSLEKGNLVDSTSSLLNDSANGASPRKKPPVQPKPDALHGKALRATSMTTSPSDQSDLASRFARLRAPMQDPRIRTQPISIPEGSESTQAASESLPITNSILVRPLGPREMPPAPTAAFRPVRSPIDVQVPEMPKPPDAIYSPSRNPDTAATINFPTSVPRSSSYVGNNVAPPVSTVGRTPGFDVRKDYFSPAPKISDNGPQRQNFTLPDSNTVSAEELTEYIRMGSQILRILMVDVRSREEFDEGHIMSPSIICIEPVTLRHGISSEDLLESLVLSPESELTLYERRHEFDLVVFYDQCSSSLKSESRSNDLSYLENFSKAMYEYGYKKQLKRRPRLLLGGLDAWADLMGPSSLQVSATNSPSSSRTNGNGIKSARPLGRLPKAREPYRFPVVRKRTYESRPLSKEEENKWDETLKEKPTREHATHDSPTAVEQDDSEELSYVRTTEDFFRRYPELPSIQESMISARPAPPPYRVEPFIPPPPVRPAPALPRQRSSGVLERAPVAEYATTSTTGRTSSGPTPGLCGLRNNGVSCYIAAAVQCLSASGKLRDYLKGFTPGPNTRVPRKAGETTDPPQLLVRNFGNLLGHMWSGGYDFVVPNTFLGYINAVHMASMPRKSPKSQAFGGNVRQHDSSEFLMFLIDVLHDETNKKRDKPDYQQQLKNIEKFQTEHLPTQKEKDNFHDRSLDLLDNRIAIRQEWRRKLAGDDSAFSNLFHGMESVLIKCTKPDCRYVKKVFTGFSILQVNFPSKYTKIGKEFPSVSLTDIFRHEFNLQDLQKLDKLPDYKCVNCKAPNTCVKDRVVTYLPDYLILEFPRFQTNQSDVDSFGNPPREFESNKIKTRITFSEKIDLKPIFIPVESPPSLPGDNDEVRGCIEPFIYDCYGIIIHKGSTIQSGHYIAYTRNLDMPGQSQSRWHQFNDQTVTPIDFAESQKPDTHVTNIFLKRRKN